MALGTGWAEGAWVDAGWVIGAWEGAGPAISADVTGSAVNASWTAIRDVGGTIIIELTGDTFIAAGTGPIGTLAQSDTFVQSFTAATSPTNGWNNEIALDNTDLVRTSDTVATITVPATGTYNPLQNEVITGEVQAAILVISGGNLSVPSFQIKFTIGDAHVSPIAKAITSNITSTIAR